MDQNNTPEAEFSLNDCKCYTQICGLLFRANHAYIWRSPYISVKVGGMYGWAVAYRAYLLGNYLIALVCDHRLIPPDFHPLDEL
jgi:hypothetical protein